MPEKHMKKLFTFVFAVFTSIFTITLSFSADIPSDWDWTSHEGFHSELTDPSEPTLSPSYPGDTRTDKHTLADTIPETSSSDFVEDSSASTVPSETPTVETTPDWWGLAEDSESSARKTTSSDLESGFTYGNVSQAAFDRIASLKNLFVSFCIALFPVSILAIIILCMFAHNEKKFTTYLAIAGSVTLTTFIVILLQYNLIDRVIEIILQSLGMS